ncbi:MAG: hypothetical protein JNJ55_02355 [Betaproteobacteria bacterium]|nr:hypothetical protein [Betaproteobacteria bacterium]
MRRLISIMLVLILPVQFSLAGASGHCTDKTAAIAQHIAHHGHDSVVADPSGGDELSASTSVEIECGVCHLGCCKLRAASQAIVPMVTSHRVDREPPQSPAQWHPAPLLRPPRHALA